MKVLASDFDGTLFFKGQFKSDDLKQIRMFQKQGHLFGLCTGRPLSGVAAPIQGRLRCDFMILSSGALILDHAGRTLYKACIDRETAFRLSGSLDKEIDFYYQTSEGTFCQRQPDGQIPPSASILIAIPYRVFSRLDELTAEIFGLSLYAGTEDRARLEADRINRTFAELEAFQNEVWIDVARRGCSKGFGIEVLKRHLQLKTVAGIGDSYNDIPLLRSTTPSFTFHTSPASVRQEAQIVVSSVAEALERLMEE